MNLRTALRSLTTTAILADANPESYTEGAKAAAELRALISHFDQTLPALSAARAALKLNLLMDAAVAGNQERVENLTSELTVMY